MTIVAILLWLILAGFVAAIALIVLATCKTGTPKPVAIRPKPAVTPCTHSAITNPPVLALKNVITNVRYPINY